MTKRRSAAIWAALLVLLPALALPLAPANAQIFKRTGSAPAQGMSTRKKLVVLGGAALLYYLYKRHQAKQAAVATTTANGAATRPVASAMPQLYRSKNGGVYYRDAQKRAVWVTAPARQVQVPYEEVQRYAPDYNNYRGSVPAAPAGYRVQTFDQFDPNALANTTRVNAVPGPRR